MTVVEIYGDVTAAQTEANEMINIQSKNLGKPKVIKV